MKQFFSTVKTPLCVTVFWLALWQIGSWRVGYTILFPSPWETAIALWHLLGDSQSWRAVGSSLLRITLGFTSATVTAIVLAVCSEKWHWVKQLLAPVMFLAKSVPVACFVILILIWFSSATLSLLIAFLMVLPILYLNTLVALEQLDPQLYEMSEVFTLSKRARLRCVILPQILPYLRSASFLALGLCFKAGIAAELIGLPKNSIGEQLYAAKLYLNTPNLFAWTVVIVALSYGYQWCLGFVINQVCQRLETVRWKP